MSKQNFVRTTDEATAEQLRKAGFTEITESASNGYCFINNGKIDFAVDKKKVVYTDVVAL